MSGYPTYQELTGRREETSKSLRWECRMLTCVQSEQPVFDSAPANLILAICAAFYFAAFFLYHFMVFRVNRALPPGSGIPHSLRFGNRDRLAKEYKALYPRSILYHLTLVCAVTVFALAVAFAGFRVWEAGSGR